MNFVQKIPKLEQIAPVYAVAVAMLYPWAISRFLWRLPSWLYFSSAGEIGVIFAYMMVVNLIESALILLVPVFLSVILPKKWFYERFVTKGALLLSLGLGYVMYFDDHLNYQSPFPLDLVYLTPLIGAVILALVFLIDWLGFLSKILIGLSDRLIVFLYISIPVSLISLVIVLFRNIF